MPFSTKDTERQVVDTCYLINDGANTIHWRKKTTMVTIELLFSDTATVATPVIGCRLLLAHLSLLDGCRSCHAPPARDSPQIESYREGDAGTSAGEGVDVTSHSLLSWGCPVVRGNHRAMTSMDGVSQPASALFLYHRRTEPISYCRFACVIGRKHRKGLPCGDVITVLPPQRCADTRLTQFLPIFLPFNIL